MSKHYVGEKVKWIGREAVVTRVWQDDCDVAGFDFTVKGSRIEWPCYDRRFDELNKQYEEEQKCSTL